MTQNDANVPKRNDPASRRSGIGRAFSIDDALLALRWAQIVRARGYSLTLSHAFAAADEVMEAFHVRETRPIATIYLGSRWTWVVDGAGQATPHANVAAALMSLLDLSGPERQALLTAHTPGWLWRFQPTPPARPARLRRLADTLARWLAIRRSG